MNRRNYLATLFALAGFIIGANILHQTNATAQSPPQLTDNQKAVISFDLRIAKMMQGGEAAGMDSEEIANMPMEGKIFEGLMVSDLTRVFGAASLPEALGEAVNMQPDADLPVEFFVQMKFKDSASCQIMVDNIKNAEGTQTVEMGDKTFYKPPAGDGGPSNLVGHRFNDTTWEFATLNYAQQPNRTFFSDALKEVWSQVPAEDAIRIAIDLESRADIINEAIEMANQMSPQAAPFVGLLANAKSMLISMDLQQENLLTIQATGVDEDKAEELRSGLDSLLGMGKMMGQMGVGQMAKDVPEMAAPAKAILDSLKATRDGMVVQVIIPKPEGFNEGVAAAVGFSKMQAEEMIGQNNIRQIVLSMHNYESAFQRFPLDVEGVDGQNSDLSWRARILPFLLVSEIHEEMDMSKSGSEEPNVQFADKMPEIFGDDGKMATISVINPGKFPQKFADISDGSSNTIVMIENPAGQPWLENNSLTIDEAVTLVTSLPDGAKLNVAFYDGHVSSITNEVPEETLRNLFDPADGNVVEIDF